MSNKIPVIEIFGPTIQGEGMVIGKKTMFVRVAGCDYRCSWCDSAFTWDGSAKEQIKLMTAKEIYFKLSELGGSLFNHVTISGGNPALYDSIAELIEILHEHDINVAIETQGSKWQEWLTKIDDLTISPKPPSSRMETDFNMLDTIISYLEENNRIVNHVSMKVVVFDEDDFEYAKELHMRYNNIPFFLQVGNEDVESSDDGQLIGSLLRSYESLIEKVISSDQMNNVRVLPQLHTLVWGNKRGV